MKVEKKRPVPSPESGPVRHTPGPWGLEYDGSVVIGGQLSVGPDSCGPDDVSRVERKANCRLIAAAPDLLQVAELCDTALFHASQGMAISGLPELIERVRTAIAKATGGVA